MMENKYTYSEDPAIDQALEEAYDEIEKLEHLNQMYKVKYEGLIASGYWR